MMRLEAAVVTGLAGYAVGRLIANDAVSVPITNRVLAQCVDLEIPADLFVGHPQQLALDAAVRRFVARDALAGVLDWRPLYVGDWAIPRHPTGRWVADMLTCPTCASFHATWAVRIAAGRWRAWTRSWWVEQFAAWAVAQTAVRLPFNSTGQKTPEDFVREALEDVL